MYHVISMDIIPDEFNTCASFLFVYKLKMFSASRFPLNVDYYVTRRS